MSALKIKLTILCFVFSLSRENIFAQQTTISPGGQMNLLCDCSPLFPVGPWSWVQSSCSDGVIVSQSQNTINFMIADNTACCKIRWKSTGFCGPAPNQCVEDIIVLPTLTAPLSVNACGSFNVGVTTGGSPGGSNCLGDYGCSNPTITWTGNCGTCAYGSVNGYYSIPAGTSVSPLTINAKYTCDPQNPWILNPVTVNVVFPLPTISGPVSIGCSGTPSYPDNGNVQYSASTPCGAGYYTWTWPSNMSFVSQAGATIVLHVNGPGSGNVTVQIFNTSGGQVFSPIASKAVNACCAPLINESIVLNSGNTGHLVEAFSTINLTDDIQSTGTATMHAGAEVHLLPGFNAVQGSQVHLYNATCNSGYMRTASPQSQEDAPITSNGQNISESQNHIPVSKQPAIHIMPPVAKNNSTGILNITNPAAGLSIVPNPSTGVFSLQKAGGFSGWLTVIDVSGQVIKRIILTKESKEYNIDLTGYAKGIYMLNMDADNGHFSKKIILE